MTIEAKLDQTNALLGELLAIVKGQGFHAPPKTPVPEPEKQQAVRLTAAEKKLAAAAPERKP